MADLNLAFWNVENLFDPHSGAGRGPRTVAELDQKIGALARAINGFFGNRGPDILGLAEVATEELLQCLIARLTGSHRYLWQGPGQADQTGLALVARNSKVAGMVLEDVQRPSLLARPRSMLVRCELPGVGEPFLLSVNHWKSRLHNAGVSSDADRMQTARWLGSKLAARTRETCVVVLGDFNAEPTEPPLRDVGIGAERHFSKVLRWRTPPVRLYNTAWRLMAEPRLWEDTRAGHPAEPRPKTTVSASFSVFDQIMVSAAALRRGPIELVEGSVCCACTAVTSEHNARGILRPRRWEEAAPGSFVGASDHFPLLATFIIR